MTVVVVRVNFVKKGSSRGLVVNALKLAVVVVKVNVVKMTVFVV